MPVRLRIAHERYEVASRRADLGGAEVVAGPELRRILGQLLWDEGAWSDGRVERLCAAVRVHASPPRSRRDLAAFRNSLFEQLLHRLLGAAALLKQPRPHAHHREDDEIESEELLGPQEDVEWIEVQLVDEDDRPVPGVRYRIELSDRRVRSGSTNANGVIRYDRLPGGTCKLTFPDLDESAWELA